MMTVTNEKEQAGASWIDDLRERAQAQYAKMPWPKKNDENWRFANKRGEDMEEFRAGDVLAEADAEKLKGRSKLLGNACARFVFANERPIFTKPSEAPGVICCSLEEAMTRHGALLEEHFMSQDARLGSAKFAALHKSRTKSGVFVYVPNGVVLDAPLEIHHWISGHKVNAFPHTLVVLGNQARISLVDHYRSADEGEGFNCSVVDLVAGCESEILYAACQDLNASSRNVQIINTLAHANARIQTLLAQLGGAWTRSETVTHLLGQGADSQMLSVVLGTGEQEVDQRTWQHHAEARATSDLLYKNVLYAKARSVFAGLIRVDDGAHHTDAYQTCRNLLMSEEAEATSMPGLEINADQVKCSHGATTGQIDSESLFYCNARGISTQKAKKLIATGFLQEVVDRFRDQEVGEMVSGLLSARFQKLD